MMNIIDNIFGEIIFDEIWTGSCEINIFGETNTVQLIIQTFEGEDIQESQRLAFLEFKKEKASILKSVENSVRLYCIEKIEEYQEHLKLEKVDISNPRSLTMDDIKKITNLKCIKIMFPSTPENHEIGLIFDADFDPELGIGVLLVNNAIEEINVQDFLLG